MSDTETNPQGEVQQKTMYDVMFGSEDTNPEQTSIEEPQEEVQEPQEFEELEEPEELEEVEEVEVEVEEEFEEPLQSYTVKVDGEEFEVTLDELRNGYQRQADYTRKSQSLAEQRKAYEANLQAVQQERGQYSEVLAHMADYQNMELAKFRDVDWKTLKEDDPTEYMEKRIEYQEAKDKIVEIKQEQARVQQQNNQEIAYALQQRLSEEAQSLAKALPEYADPSSTLKNDLRQYALSSGFSEQDVDGITDHKVVLMLHKAYLHDQNKSGVSSKNTKQVKKVLKSGTPATKGQKARRDSQAKRERLAKTGNTRDAAAVFMDLL